MGNPDLNKQIAAAEKACRDANVEPQPWRTGGHALSIAWWKLIQERLALPKK